MTSENPRETGAGQGHGEGADRAMARLPWRRPAVAVLLLVAAGCVVVFLLAPARTSDDALRRAAGELARSSPELFADFRHLSADERREHAPVVQGGGLRVLRPRGTILATTPDFAWDSVPDATRYTARVRDRDGRIVFEKETGTNAYLAWSRDVAPLVDALPPGARFVTAVEADTPSGAVRGSQAFRTLEQVSAERYAKGLTEIGMRVAEPERAVLSAHWAIRHGLWEEALRLLPDDPGEEGPAHETRAWLRSRLATR